MILLCLFCGIQGCSYKGESEKKVINSSDWENMLDGQIKLMGHRNWILIVDAAYPLQSKQAIRTIVTNDDQLNVVKKVLQIVEKNNHVFPEVFLDKEIDFVPEKFAKGIDNYRTELEGLLNGKNVSKELHEELIGMIDDSAKSFNVLVLKTNMNIPYTSVFLRLNCGYWSLEQEKEMRNDIANPQIK